MFVNESVDVFVNSETVRFHFNQIESIDHNVRFSYNLFYRNVDDFKNSTNRSKISAYHVPFALGPQWTEWTEWIEQFHQTYHISQHTFIFCSELHSRSVDQLIALDLPNVSLYIAGVINSHEFVNARVYAWMDWFHTTSEFYARTNPDFLSTRLMPGTAKPLAFDILLGNQRPHRDAVRNYIIDNNLEHQHKMTYVYYSHKSLLNNDQFIIDMDNVELDPARNYCHSVDSVKYHGSWMTLSQVIPLSIYNQTAYTLVAETNAFNYFNFYTEKIVKPMLAQRLFIVIAGQNYLKNLRAMGFKTFDNVIDETYDQTEDDQLRWQQALEQLKILSQLDQTKVLDKIKPIVQHNYRLITQKNWYQTMLMQLRDEVVALVPQTQN